MLFFPQVVLKVSYRVMDDGYHRLRDQPSNCNLFIDDTKYDGILVRTQYLYPKGKCCDIDVKQKSHIKTE